MTANDHMAAGLNLREVFCLEDKGKAFKDFTTKLYARFSKLNNKSAQEWPIGLFLKSTKYWTVETSWTTAMAPNSELFVNGSQVRNALCSSGAPAS